jgi:hypothetical protein
MGLSDGMAGFLSAVGVFFLAFLLAIGGHTFLSAPEDTALPVDTASTTDTETPGTDTGDDSGGIDTGNTNAASTAAQSDLANIGMQFTMFYATWVEGDPAPAISISGGNYVINGENIGRASEGVAITGQFARGPQDWCVQVTAAGVAENTYKYSSASGLSQGRC